MPFLPEWAPNAHPLVLHFPIALLFVAGLLDLGGLVTGDRGSWRKGATWLYVLGALSAVATWYTGTLAADSVFLPTAANALLTEHADLGKWTMWFFGGYAAARIAIGATPAGTKAWSRLGLFVLGVAGIALMTVTATHGAELVYRYGVGVEVVENAPTAPIAVATDTETGIASTEAGWIWTPGRAAAWKTEARFLEGSADGLQSALVDGGDLGDVLQLSVTEPTLFVLPGSIDRLQVDLTMDVSEFDGSVLVAHHVQEEGSYGFTSFGNDVVRLGKTENSDLLVQATEAFDGSTWRDLRVVVDGTHYRSYVDTQMAIHGHGDAFDPGTVGLRLNGTGTVRIAAMQAVDIGVVAGETTPQVDEMPMEDHEMSDSAPDTKEAPSADSTDHNH